MLAHNPRKFWRVMNPQETRTISVLMAMMMHLTTLNVRVFLTRLFSLFLPTKVHFLGFLCSLVLPSLCPQFFFYEWDHFDHRKY